MYICRVNEYDMIDENISCRKILVGLAIMGGVNYGYNKLHPKRLTNTEMVSLLFINYL